MPDVTDAEDDLLIGELARVLRSRTEPPPEVVATARELFTWRTIDAELAELTYDSLLDDTPTLARSAGQPRIMTFEAGSVTIEVEVDTAPGRRRLLGQLVPAQEAELMLRDGDPSIVGRADAMGRFILPLPGRPVRMSLRCRLADGTTVETATAVL